MNENKKIIQSLTFPVLFLLVLWIVKIAEVVFNTDFHYLGVYPMTAKGLIGIFTAPMIHGSFDHLISNSVPILILTSGIFYFYKQIAYRIFYLTYIMVGVLVWFAGRESYHIGASGLVYGFASFLFFSGVIRKYIPLMAISLIVAFLYGGMVWGIFPLEEHVSWESHLMGFICGMALSVYYRKYGPQRKKYEWEEEEEDAVIDHGDYKEISYTDEFTNIKYIYMERKPQKRDEGEE